MSKGNSTWLSLYNRLGKRAYKETDGKPIIVEHDGKLYKAKIVFDDNGSKFWLKTICEVEE